MHAPSAVMPVEGLAGTGFEGGDEPYLGDIVTVAHRFDPLEAELMCGRLRADGIPATLADVHLVQAYAFFATALGGVRVMVPATFAPQALEAIAAIEQGELLLDDGGDEEARESPDADPESLTAASLSRVAAGASGWLLLIGLIVALVRPAPMLH
jgi:hypothetical protein